MTATARGTRWSDAAIARLTDARSCPSCGAPLRAPRCLRCHADYTWLGAELWDASAAAAAALEARQAVLDRVGASRTVRARTSASVAPAASAAPAPAPRAPSAPAPAPTAPSAPFAAPGPSATVQSVLAIAGAGPVAIAAVVFTFFNPDLDDALGRGLVIGGVTLVFLLGAAVLSRRGLQFSAEAVGALALVFLALDVHALAGVAPDRPWGIAAASTAVLGAAVLGLGVRCGVRAWVWGALLALPLAPAMVGFATGWPAVGFLGAAVAALLLVRATTPLSRRIGVGLAPERAWLTVLEAGAILAALPQLVIGFVGDPGLFWPAQAGLLLAAAVVAAMSTAGTAARLWSWAAGALATAAVVLVPLVILQPFPFGWAMTLIPLAAAAGALAVGAALPVPSSVRRPHLAGGALTVLFVVASVPVLAAVFLTVVTLTSGADAEAPASTFPVAVVLGLVAVAAGLLLFPRVRDARHPLPTARTGARGLTRTGAWFAIPPALAVLSVAGITTAGRVAIGILLAALAAGAAVALRRRPRAAQAARGLRTPVLVGAHLVLAGAAVLSWRDSGLGVVAGVVVVAVVALLALSLRRPLRFVHVVAGYAYALVVLATALTLAGAPGIAVLCLTTSAAALAGIAATFLPGLGVRSWWAVLAVTAVPFLLGVAQVVVERSGWTALSTALIFLLALSLVTTRRAGLGAPLRAAAAGILVPSLAVVAVCLGAQLLVTSGSPVVLPAIAALAAVVLPLGPLLQAQLARRTTPRDAALARLAVEASTLLTAALTVALALAREASGLPTALLVLAILALGGIAVAVWGERRYGWWLAGLAATGALWCVWGIADVAVPEAYLLPPALGAALVGAVRSARGHRARGLYAAGLAIAVLPVLVLAAVGGTSVRAYGLVAASWVLVGAAALAARVHGLRMLRPVTWIVAVVAASAGVVQGVRFGLGLDAVPSGVPVVLLAAGIAATGALASALAGRELRRTAPAGSRRARSRWLLAPAAASVAVAVWPAIERDWFAIWAMWALMVVLLAGVVGVTRRGIRGATGLPPVWFVFGLAFATAVVAWSPRDLRVEWFSLPLGAALLVAGALAMRGARAPRRTLSDWPTGWSGSWALLAPGLVVALSASVTATFTDPLTWRAILVIVLALVAILVGAGRRLAAPFLIGIVVLPVENAIAFLVQIGRGIESMPWWITLAVVGAVLLIIAVTYERRAGERAGIAARLRDLA